MKLNVQYDTIISQKTSIIITTFQQNVNLPTSYPNIKSMQGHGNNIVPSFHNGIDYSTIKGINNTTMNTKTSHYQPANQAGAVKW